MVEGQSRQRLRRSPQAKRSLGLSPNLSSQLLGLLMASLLLNGCATISRIGKPPEQLPAQTSDALIFENVTLEQANPTGGRLWKLNAKQATYSESGQQADVELPIGKLYRGETAIYEVSARKGIVDQDGETVFLQEDVIATDLRDGAVVTAEEAEWRPNEDRLYLKRNIVGTKEDLTVRAHEGHWLGEVNHLHLLGEPTIIATLDNQRMRLESKHLFWRIDEQLISSEKPVQVQQIDATNPKLVANQANGQTALVNLAAEDILLSGAARLISTLPPLTITSEALRWKLPQDQLSSEAPVQVLQRDEQMFISGDRGQADLAGEIVTLTGNVNGISSSQQAQLKSDRLTWNTTTQDVQANGNVTYLQLEPPLSVAGSEASGNLNSEAVVVRSNDGQPVTTVITPKDGL